MIGKDIAISFERSAITKQNTDKKYQKSNFPECFM
jgi:hypothetical protein